LLSGLPPSPLLQWGWLVGLAVSAGVFEEVGRYAGFRVFMADEEKSWAKAVAFGVGHGGLESLLLAGALPLLTLVNVRALTTGGLTGLPPEQQAVAARQLAALAAQPAWLPLLSAWERLWTLPIHVALSVLVLQVFLRGRTAWLWLAIAAHAAVNLLAVGAGRLPGAGTTSGLLVGEAVVAVCGLVALWVIGRLRPAPPPSAGIRPMDAAHSFVPAGWDDRPPPGPG
jgi:uncharacterized membrane protein YhfC